MIRLEDRQHIAQAIEQAQHDGARLKPACELLGIDVLTLQRWKAGEGLHRGDARPEATRPRPPHALSEAECVEILRLANEPRFTEVAPAHIVPMLADEGVYVASGSSFHRVLRAAGRCSLVSRKRSGFIPLLSISSRSCSSHSVRLS